MMDRLRSNLAGFKLFFPYSHIDIFLKNHSFRCLEIKLYLYRNILRQLFDFLR